jgi:hypothetical protein
MKDIAEHILDITQNSIRAGANLIKIEIEESVKSNTFKLSITDNGRGMDACTLEKVTDPFFTSRTTRKVGLGIPLLKQNAELTGGQFYIESTLGKGTFITATFQKDHLDRIPVGDIVGAFVLLISANPNLDFQIFYTTEIDTFILDTFEIKATLDGIPINHYEVRKFIKELLSENLQALDAEL